MEWQDDSVLTLDDVLLLENVNVNIEDDIDF